MVTGIDPATLQRIKTFKVEELKACLRQLNLHITGRKADLQTRLTAVIQAGLPQPNYTPDLAQLTRAQHASMWDVRYMTTCTDDRTGQVIADVYNDTSAATGYRCVRDAVPGLSIMCIMLRTRDFRAVENIVPGALAAPSAHPPRVASAGGASRNTRIRCVCGRNYDTPQMIQCGTPGCGLWQHCSCVGLPAGRALPKHYICVACRMARADPFWEPVPDVGFHPVIPGMLGGHYVRLLSKSMAFNIVCTGHAAA